MTTTSTPGAASPDAASLSTTLPVDPFTDLAVQFGMLLGVADFDALSANPRGKMRLHNAWLHGEGVVWGFPVSVDSTSRELRVGPGLALDAVGHELYLPALSCLDLGAWYDTTSADPTAGLTVTENSGAVTFDCYVVVRFSACLAQPVPAMASPCAGSPAGVAYSRVDETVELFLRPNTAPARTVTFPELRALLGVGDPASGQPDATVQAALAALGAVPEAHRSQGWLDALRSVLSSEVAALLPPGLQTPAGSSLLFPADEPIDVVLAQLHGVTLTPQPGGQRTASVQTIDLSPRWSHVPTATIVELLSALGTAEEGGGGGDAVVDAGGPRLDPTSATWNGDSIVVSTTGSFLTGTLEAGCSLESIDPGDPNAAWNALSFTPSFDAGQNELSFALATPPASGSWVRVLVRGTGTSPVAGPPSGASNGQPVAFAGAAGGPPSAVGEGVDVAFQIQRS
jgi:hypothetical protein